MNCPYCGSSNHDAVSCEIYEMPLNIRERKRPAVTPLLLSPQTLKEIRNQ